MTLAIVNKATLFLIHEVISSCYSRESLYYLYPKTTTQISNFKPLVHFRKKQMPYLKKVRKKNKILQIISIKNSNLLPCLN